MRILKKLFNKSLGYSLGVTYDPVKQGYKSNNG